MTEHDETIEEVTIEGVVIRAGDTVRVLHVVEANKPVVVKRLGRNSLSDWIFYEINGEEWSCIVELARPHDPDELYLPDFEDEPDISQLEQQFGFSFSLGID
jgi:hypothetical protein